MNRMTSSQQNPEPNATCPICKASYHCARSSSCWCSTRKVPQQLSDYLADKYKSCICPDCLDSMIAEANAGKQFC
uniref:Cysteine-rich CWC n=1 Tax=Chlorobium chlorochromatii (strain CaD3) TaxID=340177 RepID=Q3AQ97_CHLCH